MIKVVFLYDYTGLMARPWLDAGYECWCFDGQHEPGLVREGNHVKIGMWFDADEIENHVSEIFEIVGEGVHLVFGFPDCTYLTVAGALWLYHPNDKHLPTEERRPHPSYPTRKLDRANSVELAKLVKLVGDKFDCMWALENPVSQLSTLWRKPDFNFNPCDYGGYLKPNDTHPLYPEIYPGRDMYNKSTNIWCGNGFVKPETKRIEPLHKANPGWRKCGGRSLRTKNIRSATPRGFALAVFKSNRGAL